MNGNNKNGNSKVTNVSTKFPWRKSLCLLHNKKQSRDKKNGKKCENDFKYKLWSHKKYNLKMNINVESYFKNSSNKIAISFWISKADFLAAAAKLASLPA